MVLIDSLICRLIPITFTFLKYLDKDCMLALKPHLYKILLFQVEHFKPQYFQINEDGLTALEESPPNVTLSGTPMAFLGSMFRKDFMMNNLHVRGDLECAKALLDTIKQSEISWEEHLAKVLGEDLSTMIVQSIRHSYSWAEQTWQARTEDLGAYLQDEISLLPTKNEAESFYQDIDNLRHDVARLEAKLVLLQQGFVNEGVTI